MPRYKPLAPSSQEQRAQSAERAGRHAAAADQSHATAIEGANDETAWRRKLQAAVGITPFHEQPAAAPLFHVRRLLTSGDCSLERADCRVAGVNLTLSRKFTTAAGDPKAAMNGSER
jgi:hypothetical protein